MSSRTDMDELTLKRQHQEIEKLDRAINALTNTIQLTLNTLDMNERTHEASDKVRRALFLIIEEKTELIKRHGG